jgi:hypothetical protein
MSILTFYHGTTEEKAASILTNGVDLDKSSATDSGDLGKGFYLTTNLNRARSYGKTVLVVKTDIYKMANIPNPYFLNKLESVEPITDLEILFHSIAFKNGEMVTVRGSMEYREAASCMLRDTFLRLGYSGITTNYNGKETVVFDLSVILAIYRY